MSEFFLHIVNMSISASYIVLAVLLLRIVLMRAPKWINVILWGIVAVRLVCPFSFESVLSLIPSVQPISPSIMTDNTPQVNTGIPIINNTINPIIGESSAPAVGDSVNPLQVIIPILTAVWIIGIIALFIYATVAYLKVKRSVSTAVLHKDNIYKSENVSSPFVLGMVKPRIYLPFNIDENDADYVVAHERAHIKRGDHLWKPLGFLLLSLHWFNPLMWFAYVLLCRDIELACDEKVIEKLGKEEKADYSEALLACSVSRRTIAACPLAFGEVGIKERVKGVLSYKKPALWIIIIAIVLCVALAVCFLTDPKGKTVPKDLTDAQMALMEKYPEYFGIDTSGGLDLYVWQMAPNSFAFGLLPRGEHDSIQLSLTLKGVNADEMRLILDSYDVGVDKIRIVPWHNPLSSYIGDYVGLNGDDSKAFANNIWDLLSESRVYGSESGEPELVYSNPTMSYVDSYYSGVRIEGDSIYDLSSGEKIGSLLTYHLTSINFDERIIDSLSPYLGANIRNNSFISYMVTPISPKAIDLYYVIIQDDGSALLVYGHYLDGVRDDTIRWIFNIGK